ncbi:MAG: response regulator [Saprospiraceae bacterium]|nr:response regulator [Saprospiraceae bacterium]
MLLRTLIFIVGLSFLSGKTLVAQAILAPAIQGSVKIGTYVYVFSDDSKSLQIEDILRDNALPFTRQQHDQIMIGQRREANAWIRVEVSNPTDSIYSMVLYLGDIFTRHMKGYLVADDQVLQTYAMGLKGEFSKKTLPYRSSALPFEIPPKASRKLYIRIEHRWDPVQFPIYLSSARGFQAFVEREYFLLGIFHGFLALIVLIAAILFISTRSRLFLIYLFYACASFVFSWSISGLDFQYWFPLNGESVYPLRMAMGVATILLLFALIGEYYRLENVKLSFTKHLSRFFAGLLIITLISLLFQRQLGFSGPNTTTSYHIIPGLIISLSCLYIFAILFQITFRHPKWTNFIFLIGYSGITAYGLLATPIQNAWIPIPFDKFNLFRLSTVFEMTALTILMVHRILKVNQESLLKSEQLETAQRVEAAKSTLFTNITHEFRTPLTVINGFLKQIKGHDFEKGQIQKSSDDLLRLVDQLLDLARSENGILQLKMQQADLIPFLQLESASFQHWCQQKRIDFHFSTSTEECLMDFDPIRLNEILKNLISNAIKHTPSGGKITLEAHKMVDQVELKVTDNGRGMAAKHMSMIWNRFYQVDEQDSGTGIGLSHTKMLVELMQGNIEVDSKEGQGTIFTLVLPITKKEKITAQKPHTKSITPVEIDIDRYLQQLAQQYNPKRPNLLIIEDQKSVAYTIASTLESHYNIQLADDGEEGLALAKDSLPDLIISDIMMPKLDGVQVCNNLKQHIETSHIPVILLTAKAAKADRLKGLKAGADAYLNKPFDSEELQVRVKNLIQHRDKIKEAIQNGSYKAMADQLGPDYDWLKSLEARILEQISDPNLTPPSLEKWLGMSQSKLYRKLIQLTGLNPSAFIKNIRLEEAKKQLLSTRKKIKEVAYDVGFSSPAYFSTNFKEKFGLSPSEIRK